MTEQNSTARDGRASAHAIAAIADRLEIAVGRVHDLAVALKGLRDEQGRALKAWTSLARRQEAALCVPRLLRAAWTRTAAGAHADPWAERPTLGHVGADAAEALTSMAGAWNAALRRMAERDRGVERIARAIEAASRSDFGRFGFGSGALRLAAGGDVRGVGGGRDDQIPALLSNGEFVVNADAAQRHRALLRAINGGAGARGPAIRPARFAAGGQVGAGEARPLTIHRPGWVERGQSRGTSQHRAETPTEGTPPVGAKPKRGHHAASTHKRHHHAVSPREGRTPSAATSAAAEDNKARLAHALSEAGLNAGEQEQIFGQIQAESNFIPRSEGLHYSPQVLVRIFPRYVHGVADARALIAQGPEAVARRIYGGRMGNDDAGDGLRFRGRGFVQLTGRDAYADMDRGLGLNGALLANPDLADDPALAARIAARYYRVRSSRIRGPNRGGFDLSTVTGATRATGPATPNAEQVRGSYAAQYRGRTSAYASRGATLTINGPATPPVDRPAGAPRGYARGGEVRGPGGPTSDGIPARLSPGEFVVNAGATGRHRAVLETINRGSTLPIFADSGRVTKLGTTSPPIVLASYEAPGSKGGVGAPTVSGGPSVRYGRQHRDIGDFSRPKLRGTIGPEDDPLQPHPRRLGPALLVPGPNVDTHTVYHATAKDLTPAGRERVQSWMNFFMRPDEEGGMGVDREHAAAMVGMMQGESGQNLKPDTFNPDDNGGPSGGTAQWHDKFGEKNGRLTQLQRYAAKRRRDWRDVEVQQRFWKYEAQTTKNKAWNSVVAALDGPSALRAGINRFEVPADKPGEFKKRLPNYNRLMQGDFDIAPSPRPLPSQDGLTFPATPDLRLRPTLPRLEEPSKGRDTFVQQRDAERAVLPGARSAAAPDAATQPPIMVASVDLDHSGVRETIHHVRTLKAELASLATASVSVRHSGFGHGGNHAPGAVRAALNGNFGSDGRAFG